MQQKENVACTCTWARCLGSIFLLDSHVIDLFSKWKRFIHYLWFRMLCRRIQCLGKFSSSFRYYSIHFILHHAINRPFDTVHTVLLCQVPPFSVFYVFALAPSPFIFIMNGSEGRMLHTVRGNAKKDIRSMAMCRRTTSDVMQHGMFYACFHSLPQTRNHFSIISFHFIRLMNYEYCMHSAHTHTLVRANYFPILFRFLSHFPPVSIRPNHSIVVWLTYFGR